MSETGRTRACRGIRGAITVDDTVDEAAAALLHGILSANGCHLADIAAAIFTLPDELAGMNPAAAARAIGWDAVPLLVVREHGGTATVPRYLRVLVLWNTDREQAEIVHVYLRGAAALRPDLARRGTAP